MNIVAAQCTLVLPRMAKPLLSLSLVITALVAVNVEAQSKSEFPRNNTCSTIDDDHILLPCLDFGRVLLEGSVLPQPRAGVDR